ncbi:hypothetical protein ACIGO8_01980 [Streptomyces sp. NPDC053493]|uniref:hypothetical protein n=1 Tax=Streptomyces sp. NPDC053493 TaxID=3365705 RepID=UPI0037CE05E2
MEYVKRYGGRYAAAAALAAVVVVAGCGGSPAAPSGKSPSTPAPGASSPATAPAPSTPAPTTAGSREPAPQDVLVEVVVNGGFAGVRNKLVVHYDGAYTLSKGTRPPSSGTMTAARAAELRAALEDPAYAKVPDRPTGGGTPVADGFSYYVTHDHRLVVTRDGEDWPPALQRVFDALPEGHPPTAP